MTNALMELADRLSREAILIEANNETKPRPSEYGRKMERLLREAATQLRTAASGVSDHGAEARDAWVSVKDRLPEDGVGVLVYTPGEDGGIFFDACDDGIWIEHSDHYDHYLSVGSGTMDCPIIGPSQEAPYTHWHAIPARPSDAALRAREAERVTEIAGFSYQSLDGMLYDALPDGSSWQFLSAHVRKVNGNLQIDDLIIRSEAPGAKSPGTGKSEG